jgi:hypothetical protein
MVIDYENVFTSLESEHLKMGGRSSPNPKKKIAIGSKCPCNPKTPNLLYLANPPLNTKNNFTISFKTLENGGVGHLKTPKKNPILVGRPM